MNKKNIIFVIPTLRMGGAEKSLVSLLKALDSERVNVDLFLFEEGGVLQSEVPGWVHIIKADSVTRGMTLEIRNYLKDVIKTGDFKAAVARVWITVMSRFSKKKRFSWNVIKGYIPEINKKYDVAIGYLEGTTDFFVIDKINANNKIGWIHIDFSKRDVTPEEADYYSQFDELVTISEVCREAFINKFPEAQSKMHVLENIVLTDEICRKAADTPIEWNNGEKVHLVTVGRLEYQKGIDIAVKTAEALVNRKIAICWHVYGDGSMKEDIEKYVEEHNLKQYFILEGLRENPYPYMKNADIIVQTSRWEGKSIVLDEAKILGKAIVVTDYPSVNDQIIDKKTGIITKIEPEAIADGIELLIQDRVLKKYLEENAVKEPNQSLKALDLFYQLIEK